MTAYMRRKKFESRILAVEIMNTLGESLQGGSKQERIPGYAMISLMGGFS